MTFRSDLNYDFMNDQEFKLIEHTNAIINRHSSSSESTTTTTTNNTSLLPPSSSLVLNETFQDHLQTSTMLVDLHLYYMEAQQRRLSDGLALQDIGEFIRDHVDEDGATNSDSAAVDGDSEKNICQIIKALKSSSTVDELALSRKMQRSLSVEGFKTEPGFLTLKVPDIALAADSLSTFE